MNLVHKALGCLHKVPGKYFGYHDSVSASNRRGSSCPRGGKGDGSSSADIARSNFGPMPPIHDLEKEFDSFVTELDLTPEKQEAMYDIPPDKKWLILCEQSYREERQNNGFQAPENFIAVLNQVKNDPTKSNSGILNHLEALRVTLKTQSHSYVRRFLQLGGQNLMIETLNICTKQRFYGSDQLATAILACFKALLNSTHGRHSVLSSSKALVAVAISTSIESSKGKVIALEILSGLCLLASEGHKKVLDAVTRASKSLGERTRFQKLVSDLWRRYQEDKEEIRVKTAIMSFVNALFKTGHAETSLEFRLHLRFEFLMIGIEPIINEMRSIENPILQDHLDLFDMMRQEDEQEFAAQYEISKSIDFKQPDSLCEALISKTDHSDAYPHLISLMGHLLLLPGDQKNIELWRFFDMVIQQVSLQASIGEPCESVTPFPKLNMERLLSRLHTEKEYEGLTEALKQERSRSKSLEQKLHELEQQLVEANNNSRIRNHSGSSGYPLSPPESPPTVSPTPQASPVGSRALPPPAPPPPPVGYLQGSKGYFLNGAVEGPKKDVPKPSVALKSVNWQKLNASQLEGTIWSELNDEELYGVLNLREVESLFAAGGSRDKNDSGNEEGDDSFDYGTIRRRRTRDSTITLVEARRAQNCTILLSKLKLSNKEMKHALLTMDEDGLIPKDMVEQLLKFVPTKEEMELIKDANPHLLATADRFLWEMNQIPRYEHRLRCLHYRKVFKDRLEDLKPQIDAVTRASGAVLTSSRLRQLLAIILALGNYLNHGKRNSDASGFSLNALNNLVGVKSGQKLDYSLLHLLVEIVEKQFPELLRVKKDLGPVYDASRVNGTELESEIKTLESGLAMISEELKFYENSQNSPKKSSLTVTLTRKTDDGVDPSSGELLNTSTETEATVDSAIIDDSAEDVSRNGDIFVPVMTDFLQLARSALQELNLSYEQMKTAFISCVKAFGTSSSVSPDDFFSIFGKFLSSFSDIHRFLWKQREEEERRKRNSLTINTKKSFLNANFGMPNFRKKKDGKKENERESGDFDQLISALQSGELFSEELTRLRSSFRRPNRRGTSEQEEAVRTKSQDGKPNSSNAKVEFRKKKPARSQTKTKSAPLYENNGRGWNFNFDVSRER